MSRTLRITIQVQIDDELDKTEVDALAESLLDFLADDPDDLFPLILAVDYAEWKVLP